MKKISVILSASNNFNSSNYNSQMIPIHGKPAISCVIDNIYSVTEQLNIVVNSQNIQVIELIEKIYPKANLIKVNTEITSSSYKKYSILTTILEGIKNISDDADMVEIVLGDTMVLNIPDEKIDTAIVSSDIQSSERWCLVDEKNSFIKNIYNKQNDLEISDKFALVGVYHFTDVKLLKDIVAKSIQDYKTEISDVLSEYKNHHKIKCLKTDSWFDFGHKAGILKAQNFFYNSRDFNNLKVDNIKGTITKSSPKITKISDEKDWYENLPKDLSILAPRVLSFQKNEKKAYLEMEIYGYPPLSELFVYGNLSVEEWQMIIKHLFSVQKKIREFSGELSEKNFIDLYKTKTWNRVDELKNQNDYWKKIWDYEELIINNEKYKNIKHFTKEVDDFIDDIISNVKVTIMHGDYCFSNILFDTNNSICKLIDPRGRLSEKTVYGDPRYDIAKLRHSVVGGYDFIVHKLYKFSESENIFTVSDNYHKHQKQLNDYFDKLTTEFGYEVREIQFIESLLFLSMIPLHKDDINRQKVFYLKAVKKLNDLFNT